MSIRITQNGVLDYNDAGNLGATSVAGGVAKSFLLPQDTDNVTVKMTASLVGAAASAVFQTSDDGGSTWYDVARTSVVSLANAQNAQWLSIPTFGNGQRTGVIQSASVITAGIGSAAASTLGSQQVSGLPILGVNNRVFIAYTGNITTNDGVRVIVRSNNQSATA